MLELPWIVLFISLALLAGLLLFPASRSGVKRGGKALFYATALVLVISWTLTKSVVLLAGRRMIGR